MFRLIRFVTVLVVAIGVYAGSAGARDADRGPNAATSALGDGLTDIVRADGASNGSEG